MSDWGKNYPLFLCLLITNLLFGLGAMVVGALLIDWASFPESSVQFLHWLKSEQAGGQQHPLKNEAEINQVMKNEGTLYTVLMIVGTLSILFGFLTVLIGLDIAYMLCLRDHSVSARSSGPYGSEMEKEMSQVVSKSEKMSSASRKEEEEKTEESKPAPTTVKSKESTK